MADKKFGIKLFCKNCEKKFYTLGKTEGLICPVCNTEYNLDEDVNSSQTPIIKEVKTEKKDEFADIENVEASSEDSDDDVISLDDPAIEDTAETN